ncbi:50S ribosomal protein L25-like [Salvia divinorum]|uniref:50S ribosomal protein L25-like n=1 Tax=Salvia divinorum TaxID=28513 RepID=A0ABD1I3C5_SALDI
MSKCWRAAAGVLKNANKKPPHRSYHTIQAVPRELSGHRISARERAQGRIPAVVFSQKYFQRNPNDPTSFVASTSVSQKFLLTTERKQIKSILKDIELPFFCSTAFPLQIRAGSGSSTILQNGKIHRDDEGNILNLVFAWAEDGSELKVEVPIVYAGEDACPGVKKGGTLLKIRKSLKYVCPSEHIPQKIEVDVSNLDIEDRVSIHDPVVHSSLKLLSKNESIPICKVKATYIDIENTKEA